MLIENSIFLDIDCIFIGKTQPILQRNLLVANITSPLPQKSWCICTGCSIVVTAHFKHMREC